MEKILINVGICLVVVIGFLLYWGKSSGVFKEDGIVTKWWNQYKEKRKADKISKKAKKN